MDEILKLLKKYEDDIGERVFIECFSNNLSTLKMYKGDDIIENFSSPKELKDFLIRKVNSKGTATRIITKIEWIKYQNDIEEFKEWLIGIECVFIDNFKHSTIEYEKIKIDYLQIKNNNDWIIYDWITINDGDYIVKEGDNFHIYTPSEFDKLFKIKENG